MIQLIDHIAITVRDLQETIDFYSKVGFRIAQRSETPTQVIQFLEAGQARLEVFAPKERTSQKELGERDIGMKHIAIKVDDIWKSYKELKARGVVFDSEPWQTSVGNVIVFFKDPNGILLQLLQR